MQTVSNLGILYFIGNILHHDQKFGIETSQIVAAWPKKFGIEKQWIAQLWVNRKIAIHGQEGYGLGACPMGSPKPLRTIENTAKDGRKMVEKLAARFPHA